LPGSEAPFPLLGQVPLLPARLQVQVTFVPPSQDEFARAGTEKTTWLPMQFPTMVWLVPGPSAGGSVSLFAGHEALEPVQTSALSQAFAAPRQVAPALPGVCVQPPVALHASTVHGF